MDALLPPHAQLTDFLARSDHGTMLDWVLDNERRFSPATVRSGNAGVLNPELRVALTCPVSGPLKTLLQERLLEALPMLMQRIGATGPEPRKLELEFAAH